MKVLYCTKCKSLVRLRTDEGRKCRCSPAEVMGRYHEGGEEADISDNENTISIVIGTGSLDAAIERMQWWQEHRPESGREDYKTFSSISAWVRPNFGPGNKRS